MNSESFFPAASPARTVAGVVAPGGIEPPQEVSLDSLVSREIGLRLASLADGEGCFHIGRINKHKRTSTFNCSFVIKLRLDDLPFLSMFHAATGLGSITTQDEKRENQNPQVVWRVMAKAECRVLVEIFDRYPLWSKKANDYAIWRLAVQAWLDHEPGDSWKAMEYYADEIRRGRRYRDTFAQEASDDTGRRADAAR